MSVGSTTRGSIQSMDVDLPSSIFQIEDSADTNAEFVLWQPDSSQLDVLDAIPGIGFQIETASDGKRLILPAGTTTEKDRLKYFFTASWHYGLQILQRQLPNKFTPEVVFSYRMLWFFFNRARKMQQYIRKRFLQQMDLELQEKEQARKSHGEEPMGILPWTSDEQSRKRGYPASLREFFDQGNQEAFQHGVEEPTTAHKIEFSLARAAKLESRISLDEEQAAKLVKNALFDVDDITELPTGETAQQLEELILHHLFSQITGDKNQPEFDNWFAGGRSVLVKELARQLKDHDESDATGLITAALVQYGWYASQYLAGCIQAVMHDVSKCLPQPLTADEKDAFELLYNPQSSFGGLPLILLGDRLEFVRIIAGELLAAPKDTERIGEIHCLLQFYVSMVQARREADRESKRASHHTSQSIQAEDVEDESPELVFHPLRSPKGIKNPTQDDVIFREQFKMLCLSLAVQIGFKCSCESPDLNFELHEQNGLNAMISLACSICDKSALRTEVRLPRLQS